MDRSRLTRLLEGTPPVLPPALDRASERWWRTPPRVRALSLLVALVLLLVAGTVRLASSPWGPPVPVLVAARDLPLGAPLDADAVRTTEWPARLVPPGALATVADSVAIAPLAEGSVLTDRLVGEGGLGAALPDGSAAVAVPSELVPVLLPGARLDLVGAELDGRGVALATAATVLTDDGEHVWVAVDHQQAPAVAAAAAAGTVTVVVLPP
jgi:pilus assembly protein CpaB